MSSKGKIQTQIRRTFLSTIARLCCWCDPVNWANQKVSSSFANNYILSWRHVGMLWWRSRGLRRSKTETYTDTDREMGGGGGGLKCVSRWYNRTGWLGVKHQVTYLLTYLLTYSFSKDPVPCWHTGEETSPVLCVAALLLWCNHCSDFGRGKLRAFLLFR